MKTYTDPAPVLTAVLTPSEGLAPQLSRFTLSGPTMGTRYSAVFFTATAPDAAQLGAALQAAVDRVDGQMSTWKPDSDISKFNRAPVGEWLTVPHEFLTVLLAGLEIGAASRGAFDVGVGVLVDAWGFGAAGAPSNQRQLANLASVARQTTAELVELDIPSARIRKRAPLALDFSGIAKGFGVDQLAACLDAFGIGRYLVSIDGEVRASGLKPGGTPWMVAIEKPERNVRDVARVQELSDLAIGTSGDYRNFREHDGATISHSIDPRTGRPVVNAVTSVSVAAPSCMIADAWATALLVLGETAGPELAEALGLSALFMVRDPGGTREIATGQFRD